MIQITNNKDTTRTQQFTYDSLNRIITAKTTSTTGANCWGQNFGYDQWANLTSATVSQCTAPGLSMAISASNQFTTTGFSYDASGNVLADGTNTYAWNAESEIKTAAGVNYTYDGDGDRVQKSNGKIYWYGAGSEILDESDSSGNITDEYIFFGGKRIAHRVVSGSAIYYYAEDFLGSSRVMTTSTGTVCYDADFYPFGGERVVTNTCPQNYKFTGKERDAETNNDDFGARYYSSQFGRWISPDWSAIPAPVPYANLTNPQTLNLYAMVSDNPETFSDLDGHGAIAMSSQGNTIASADGLSMFDNAVDPQQQQAQQQAVLNVAIYRSDNLSGIGDKAVSEQLDDLKKSMDTLGIKVHVVSDVKEDISDALKGKGLTKGAFNIIVGTGTELGNNASGSGFSPSRSNPQYSGTVINEFKNVGNSSVITHEVLHGLNGDWTSKSPNSAAHEIRAHWDAFLLRNGIGWGMSDLSNRVPNVER